MSNEPNVPRGLHSHSMPFRQQPSKRNFPPGNNHPLRATLPSAYVAPSQPVPTPAAPVAEEGCYSVNSPDLMSLSEPVVDYREPPFERHYLPPAQNYAPHHPHEQLPPSGYNDAYLQGQQYHPQMGIPPGLNEHREMGVVLPQSAHISPQHQLSPLSPGHAPIPTRPPLYIPISGCPAPPRLLDSGPSATPTLFKGNCFLSHIPGR